MGLGTEREEVIDSFMYSSHSFPASTDVELGVELEGGVAMDEALVDTLLVQANA